MPLREPALVREHVKFLIDDARKLAREDVGHDPPRAVAGLRAAVAALGEAITQLNATHPVLQPPGEPLVIMSTVPEADATDVAATDAIIVEFDRNVQYDGEWTSVLGVAGTGQGAQVSDVVIIENVLHVQLSQPLIENGEDVLFSLIGDDSGYEPHELIRAVDDGGTLPVGLFMTFTMATA